MKTWVFQDHRQRQKLGAKCPWSVGWIDPDGRRRSKRVGSRSMADKVAKKTEADLIAGVYFADTKKAWQKFREEYETEILSRTSSGNQVSAQIALDHFERLAKPVHVRSITTETIDRFVSARIAEQGAHENSTVSVATVNKELRHIRAAIRKAYKRKHLAELPDFQMLREPEKIPRFVTAEHFAAIYRACDSAKRPSGLPYSPADWWRGLLSFLYMTGWRIGETLALRRDDVDFAAGTALTRAADNKGKRDALIPLHPVVVEHLRRLGSFHQEMFPWLQTRRRLWLDFHAIQKAAGVTFPCEVDHEHTEDCGAFYGFHDFRRAFATVNAQSMTGDALQRLMRHRDYSTTQRYINMAGQLSSAVGNLHVPDVLRTGTAD